MADYIDRQAAVSDLEENIKARLDWVSDSRLERQGLNVAMCVIENLPSIDAVEVVRCKNCKYWQDNNGGYPHEECRWGHDETPNEDDYCSYGERKDD